MGDIFSCLCDAMSETPRAAGVPASMHVCTNACVLHEIFAADLRKVKADCPDCNARQASLPTYVSFFHEAWARRIADLASDPSKYLLMPQLLQHEHPTLSCDVCGSPCSSRVEMRALPPVFTVALVWETSEP
eukprot:UC1_evm1s1576